MGLGDQLIATGLARGAAARGKKIAFGDRQRICWDGNSAQMFANNPNIAPPGSEGQRDIEWVEFYKGNRGYNRQLADGWEWNMAWRCVPGEVYFTDAEKKYAETFGNDFIVVEPNIPDKLGAPNKDWGLENYQSIVNWLNIEKSVSVVQFAHGIRRLKSVELVDAKSFRNALAILSRAKMYIGPEGGLHHGAAAVNIFAVVMFGAWIPPQVTGYDFHVNVSVGEACGKFARCKHCQDAMATIKARDVMSKVEMLW